MVDNPSHTTPSALNIGIRASRGRHIAILGAHAEYAPNYLQTCLELLQEHPEVCCVGGPIISHGKGLFGRAVAAAMSHPIGVGNAKHRWRGYEGYAEGACFPIFRKEIFETVGLFDETLVCAEDDELNYRLAQRGEKVFIFSSGELQLFCARDAVPPRATVFQVRMCARSSMRKHRLPATFRHVVPTGFMFLMVAMLVVGWSLPSLVAADGLSASYRLWLYTSWCSDQCSAQTRMVGWDPVSHCRWNYAYGLRGWFHMGNSKR